MQDDVSDEEDSEDEEKLSDTEAQTGDSSQYSSDDEYEDCEDDEGWQTCSEDAEGENERILTDPEPRSTEPTEVHNYSHLVQSDELMEIFKSIHTGNRVKKEQVTIGLVSDLLFFFFFFAQ